MRFLNSFKSDTQHARLQDSGSFFERMVFIIITLIITPKGDITEPLRIVSGIAQLGKDILGIPVSIKGVSPLP